MSKVKVLFVCIHNSARSQMAEAFLNHYGKDYFEAFSAGIEPGVLNPWVVEVMKEEGLDLSLNKTKSVQDILKEHKFFDCVITVCDEGNAQKCPVFPGPVQRLHWGFPDPSSLTGTDLEKITAVRQIRDQIKQKIQHWLKDPSLFPPRLIV